MEKTHFKKEEIKYKNEKIKLSYFIRPGSDNTILYLHGLGSTKMDFIDSIAVTDLDKYTILAMDLPGCGSSSYPKVSLEMPDLAKIIEIFVIQLDLNNITLIYHSFTGIPGLIFAEKNQDRLKKIVSVEGNMVEEDTGIFSLTVRDKNIRKFDENFNEFSKILKKSGNAAYDIFAESLADNISFPAFYDYCVNIVEQSVTGELYKIFISLSVPRLFIYGEENNWLSYINDLNQNGIKTAEIAKSHHFPVYSNISSFYLNVCNFINEN